MIPSPSQKLPAPQRPTLPEDSEIDWRALLIAAHERLWLFMVLPVIGAGIGWGIINRATPMFQSRATLEVEDKQQVVKVEEVSSGEVRDTATMNTVAATINSRTFLATVASREKFHEREGFFPPSKTSAKPVYTEQDAVNLLASVLGASIRPQTKLLDITAQHQDPAIARDIAQAVAEGIIRYGTMQRAKANSVANDFLVQEADRLKTSLEKAELELQRYRDDNNAISLDKDQNLVVSELKDLSAKLGAAKSSRAQLETDFAALKVLSDNPEAALSLASVSQHPLVNGLTQAIAAKKSDLAVIRNRYLPKHPKYAVVKTELTNLEQQLIAALPEVLKQLQSSAANAATNEEKLAKALSEQERIALDLDKLAVQYNMRQRDVDTNLTMYQSVLSRLKEVDTTKGMDSGSLKIHEVSQLPYVPFSPSHKKIYSSTVGGAFMLAFALAAALHFMDRTVKTVDQAEKGFGLPVMSAVALDKKLAGAGLLAASKEPHGAVAESFRSLRAMASLLGPEEERRTFLITSAVPGEGKTFCASNYAASLAQQGLKTLLIDADLRKPRVSSQFFKEHRKPGLTEVLVGQCLFAEALHDTEIAGLMVMPAGERSPNPAELLAGRGLRSLLDTALQQFDRVIIDSAPVLAVSDTLLLAPLVETVFQVIQWHKTPAPVVQRAISLMRESGKAPSGLILNQMPQKSKSYYYHYSPGYYGSKGVYGAA